MIRSYNDAFNQRTGLETSNERTKVETSLIHLPNDCMSLIFQSFSKREILTMEQVSWHYQTYVINSWKRLCIENKIRLDWSKLFPSLTIFRSLAISFPEKFSYLTEKAIQCFLDDRRILVKHIKKTHVNITEFPDACTVDHCLEKKTKTIYKKFKSVGEWNAYLGNYILQDLAKIVSWDAVRNPKGKRIDFPVPVPFDIVKKKFRCV